MTSSRVLYADQAATDQAPAAPAPVWDREAANQRNVHAVRQHAPLAEALDDLEARIAELVAKTKELGVG